ncbi:MAG TPA: amidohydrolase family protein, partial [Vicinamibacterales bacterium]|nr:amidohydrolase family protein [Vicinamibacterales bacterium]
MSAYRGPFFDVDVHHRLNRDTDIVAYLPNRWHDYVHGDGRGGFSVSPALNNGTVRMAGAGRDDAVPANGMKPGSDFDTLREQLLEPHADYRAVLTHQLGEFGGHFNHYFARDLSRAMNDWTIDAWLERDERFYGVIIVPLADPEAAVEEIRRVGPHPRMLSVHIGGNVLGRPLGDPLYHPIYDAAAEHGLCISVHIAPLGAPHMGVLAAGGRLSFLTAITQYSQQAMHYISSLIVHGVFEKWPNLRVLLMEYGIGWLPFALWRLDQAYPLLQAESPWVRRLPSEYIRDHVRLSTQPLEEDFDDHHALFR